MGETVAVLCFFGWLCCAVAGGLAASRHNASAIGAMLGLLLGPVGVVAALGVEGRDACPRCAGRLDGRGAICQHCGGPLKWKNDAGGWRIVPDEPQVPRPAPKAPPPAVEKPLPRGDVTGGWG